MIGMTRPSAGAEQSQRALGAWSREDRTEPSQNAALAPLGIRCRWRESLILEHVQALGGGQAPDWP